MTTSPSPLPIRRFDPRESGLCRWLGPLEAVVMECVWSAERAVTVKKVWRELRASHNPRLAYTTVMTTMLRLVEKRLLDRERRGMAYHYTPTETRSGFEARQTQAVLKSLEESE